jgi:hypothetical protein
LAARQFGFLSALDYYWNTIWCKDSRVILVVCGSAASWMIKNIISNPGGLYNRITIEIPLYPFNLGESKGFLGYLGFKLNYSQVLELYMVFGGVTALFRKDPERIFYCAKYV